MDLSEIDLNKIKEAIDALAPERRRELLAWMEAQKPPSRAAWRSRFCARTEWFRLLPGLTRAVAGTLVGLIGFACVEAAIFDSGWYSKYLEPDSTAGQVEYNLFWLRRTWPPKTPDVLVMGDSRIAEAFSARVAGESVNGKIHFMNFGMPGSTPRVWYYTLRDAEKDRNRFSAIVIPFNRYSDFDSGEDLPNRVTDLNFLAARLRWSECGDFSRSYPEADARRSVLTGCLIRGLALREDVRDFLSGIPERLRRTKNWRNNGERYIEGYDGKYEDLKGLTVDTATGKIHFPPGAQDWQIESTRAALRPYTGRQSGELTAYRQKWIGGILDLYRNSATRIIFIQLPYAPLPVPDAAESARFIDSVKWRSRLTVLPGNLFLDLEKPELFADGMHLNRTGRELFSAELAKAVAPIMEQP